MIVSQPSTSSRRQRKSACSANGEIEQPHYTFGDATPCTLPVRWDHVSSVSLPAESTWIEAPACHVSNVTQALNEFSAGLKASLSIYRLFITRYCRKLTYPSQNTKCSTLLICQNARATAQDLREPAMSSVETKFEEWSAAARRMQSVLKAASLLTMHHRWRGSVTLS